MSHTVKRHCRRYKKDYREPKLQKYSIPEICEYCGGQVVLKENILDGRRYGLRYSCVKCHASVSVHPGTKIPMGCLANRELARLKVRAHSLLDPIWKKAQETSKDKSIRDKAYLWLARQMNISTEKCHIGWFKKAQTLEAIKIIEEGKDELYKFLTKKERSKNGEKGQKKKSGKESEEIKKEQSLTDSKEYVIFKS